MADEQLATNQLPEEAQQQLADLNKNMIDSMKGADLLARQMRSNGIYRPEDLDYQNRFYRFRRIDPYHMVEGGFEYLFFTKPDLAIIGDDGTLIPYHYQDSSIYGQITDSEIGGGSQSVPYFIYLMRDGYINTLADLCYSYRGIRGSSCPFIRILSNRKTSNMDIPDIVVSELETAQNMYGTRIFYPTSSMKSDEDVEFSIEFEDTQYLEIYHLFKAYDYYRQLKWLGLIQPKSDYIINKILHDHISIYKFIVDTDGETLLYWAKATGVYPKTISRSSFSELQASGGLKITVSFKLSGWFEDMEPNILADFNQLALKQLGGNSMTTPKSKKVDIWDNEIQGISGENVDYFYIDSINVKDELNRKYTRYLLRAGSTVS